MSAVAPVLRMTLSSRALALAATAILATGVAVAGGKHFAGAGGSAKDHPAAALAGLTLATPSLLAYPVADATRVLRQQGFRVQVEHVRETGIGVNPRRVPPVGTVLGQTPAPLSQVPAGTVVTLFVLAP